MGKQKTVKKNFNLYRDRRAIDIWNTIYLLYLLVVYPLYMDDGYFNITITRAKTFAYGSLVYVGVMLILYGIEYSQYAYFEKGRFKTRFGRDFYQLPEFYLILFGLANVFAMWMAEDKKEAFWGTGGRYFGAGMILVIVLTFIVASRNMKIGKLIYIPMTLTALFCFVLSMIQCLGYDAFGLRAEIVEKQKEVFISTFGNINSYAGYIALMLPMFVVVFVFGEKLWSKIVAGITMVIGAAAVYASASDNVYLGLLAFGVVFLFLAMNRKKLAEYVLSILLMVFGYLGMVAAREQFYIGKRKLDGLVKLLGNVKLLLILTAILFLLTAVVFVVKYKADGMYYKICSKQGKIAAAILLGVGLAAFCVFGVLTKNSMFTFNFKWGNFRGYIWTRSISLFKDATLGQKIFGYGNESVKALMAERYQEEMIQVTTFTYDNCHNELLQYLVTTGLFGLITYLGFVGTSFVRLLKRGQEDLPVLICLAGSISYFAQGIVNLNQPIITPFFFILIAAGLGRIRYIEEGYGIN